LVIVKNFGSDLTFNIRAVADVIRESFRLRRPAFV
jgi:hypothetical protein